jgi:hypothetical protein
MRKYSIFVNPYFITAIIVSLIFIWVGCQKSITQQPENATILDSIIVKNLSVHFIYDSRQRIIEERVQGGDTLAGRYTYEYNGNDSMPFRKNYFHSINTTPDLISLFYFNYNKQKVYDTTYSPGNNEHTVTYFNYYANNRISVMENWQPSLWRADTIYLNNSGNIDSIRTYFTGPVPGSLVYAGTTKFTQYDTHLNVFKSLSSNNCNYYSILLPWSHWGDLISINYPYYPVFDYYNTNYFTAVTTNTPFGNFDTYQKQIQFNSDNLPVSEKVIGSHYGNQSDTFNYRFVYR